MVLLAVAVGGALMGVGGMLLMVPLDSVIYTLVREYTHKRLEQLGVDEEKLRPQPPILQSHLKKKHAEMKEKHAERKTARKERREEKRSGK